MVSARLPEFLHTVGGLTQVAVRHRAQVLIANDLHALMPATVVGFLLDRPVVAAIHDLSTPPGAGFLLRRCAAVVACSQAAVRSLPAGLTQARVVPNGVAEPVLPAERRDGPWTLLCFSRLEADKNLPALVAALERCRDELLAQGGVRLLVAGEGPDRAALERQIAASPARELIHLLGWRDDRERLWAEAHALVLPSGREALPLSLIEGQLAGLPVMGVRGAGGVEEVIADGRTGILADDPSPTALAAGLLRLRREAPGGPLAESGRASARQVFSPEVHATGWRDLICGLVGPRP
jgi:glycosyltransferase involved in cell wall biosynthesis